MITTKELTREANSLIKDIFYRVIESDDKELWKKAIGSIDTHIKKLEHGDRGVALFVWIRAKQLMANRYGKKFISNPIIL